MSAFAVLVIAAPTRAQRSPLQENVEQGFLLAPAVQAGTRSQELSLGLARGEIAQGSRREGGPYLISSAFGARLELVSSGWSPQAVHGLLFASTGAFVAALPLPVVLEAAGGYGAGNGRGYGIAALAVALGVAGKFEVFARGQAAVGTAATPAWFSNWLFGLRYGIALGERTRTRVSPESGSVRD
jgi:hypothetical protein